MAPNTMDHIDWQLNKTLLQSNKYLLENEISADVTFRVGENQEAVKAHRLTLSCRSPVFDRMLNGHFKETEEDPIINDVDVETFKAVLRYCYFDCVDTQKEIAFTTLCAATKYMLPILKDEATQVVGNNLDTTNILDIYKYSVSTNDESLRKCCQGFIECNLSKDLIWSVYEHAFAVNDVKVVESCRKYFKLAAMKVREALVDQAFLEINYEVLLDFLHINDVVNETEKMYENMTKGIGPDTVKYEQHFGIFISEIELFKACNSWAEAECLRQEYKPTGVNKRTVLGDALFLIRFPTILNKDLASIVYPTGILTEEEREKVFEFKETDNNFQIAFPARQRYALLAVFRYSNKSIVSLESEERFLLTKVWCNFYGKYKIIIKDEATGKGSYFEGFPNPTQTTYFGTQGNYLLHSIDIEPFILEAGRKYILHIEDVGVTNWVSPRNEMKSIEIGREQLKEVKITPEVLDKMTSMLTLCLV